MTRTHAELEANQSYTTNITWIHTLRTHLQLLHDFGQVVDRAAEAEQVPARGKQTSQGAKPALNHDHVS